MSALFFLCLGSDAYAQLTINKSVDVATAYVGNTVTYTIQYSYLSTTDPFLLNASITDQVPSGLQNVVVSSALGVTNYDPVTQIATVDLGDLPAGTTGDVTIVGTVSYSAPPNSVLTNQATISGTGASQTSNQVQTTVLSTPWIGAYKVLVRAGTFITTSTLEQGESASYAIFVDNSGNVPLSNVCITDPLPIPDKLVVTSIETGVWVDYGTLSTVNIEYTTNLNSSWTPFSGSPFSVNVNSVVTPSLASGEYITQVRWCFNGDMPPGMRQGNPAPLINITAAADTPLGNQQNCFTATSSTSNVSHSNCAYFEIIEPITTAIPGVNKYISTGTSASPGQSVEFILSIENNADAAQVMQDAILYDLFPNTQLEYVSWNYNSPYNGTPPIFTQIPNYRTINGIPHDLLRWEFPDDFAIGEAAYIQAHFIVKTTAPPGAGLNRSFIEASNRTQGVCGFYGNFENDGNDVDNDGNTTEEICSHDSQFNITASALLTSEKLVKGQLDAVYSKYPLYGYTVPGGLADYRLRVRNEGNVPMTDILVIDILPWVGDVGVLDPQTRDTDWRPNLAGPVTPPTGVTVYYSTENNPCRSELGYSPGGCTGPTWSLTPPIDITTVQSLKFDFGNIVLQPGDSLILAWPMRAPVNAPTNNEIAWNSFGYIGTRTDNNQTLLPSEPLKVGIVVQPLDPAIYGDYVWLDTDQDGVQDGGESGISGVRVDLYKDNGDGISNPLTDLWVGFTVTDGSGYYLFPNLPPGDYFAVFSVPAGYTTSPTDQGGNDATDSDGVITPVTNLISTEDDRTWDLGIYLSSVCDVEINSYTISPCVWDGTNSTVTVNVFVTWANAPAGENITVTLNGNTQTINVSGGATSPAMVSFTMPANNTDYTIVAAFNGTSSCSDSQVIHTPLPCQPNVCVLNIDAVNVGACNNGSATLDVVVSWSGNPAGENIEVTANAQTQTINVVGGVLSPATLSFTVPADGSTNNPITAEFVTTSTCSDSDSYNAPTCTLPCTLTVSSATPTACNPATDTYNLTITVSYANPPAGDITINVGGTIYTVTPDGTSPDTYTISNLSSNGTQDIDVSATFVGDNACTHTLTDAYDVPVSCACNLSASANGTNVLCNGGNDGTASASATGNTGAVTYLWSNGATTQNVNSLTAGTYSVTITETPTCTAVASYTVTEPSAALDATCSKTDVTTNGGADGTASVSASGGTSPYAYLWNTGATTASISGLTAGTYSVTVTDANGCTDECTTTVQEPGCNLTASASGTNVLCNGGADGTASATASGNTGAVTYLWSNGATTQNVNSLTAGTYSVTITETPTCTAVASYTVTEPSAALDATCSKTDVTTNGGADGTASVSASGGTSPYTYLWNTGATTASISGLVAGTYSVTVTDANGCTDECTTTVQEPGCNLTASASGTNVLCNGGADGTATASATGNTGAVTYLWSNGATTQNVNSLTAGTYSVTITETPTCTAVASYTVTEPSAALDATCSKTDVTTNGGADGTASVSASGGTSPYTYLWNTGATTQSISGLVAGTYSVTVTDANGCTDECTTTVQEPGCNLTASANGTNVLCNGGADGTASATASGNTGAVAYLWSNGATTASISSLTAGTYSVTITETPTCTAVASYTVTEPSAALDATCSKTDVTTNGGADGTASVSASGGTSPYTYLWNTGATTQSISGLTAGTYSVTVTDANGCTDECTTTVQEPGCNLSASASGTNVLCTGGADGTASATASGNTGAVTYLWSNGATTQNVNSLTAGTYSVTITETPTCTAVASYTVTEPSAALDATCSKTDVTTNGGADGTASVSASGGTSPYAYLWNTGATTASISGLVAGTYSVTVTDANGCTDECTTTVQEPGCNLTASASGTNVLCNGGADGTASASATGNTGAVTYLWSNGATTQNVNSLTAGTYSVTITETPTCTAVASYTVTEPSAALDATCSKTDVTTNGGADGTASVSASGGTSPYTYLWNTGATTASISGLVAGTYSVTVTDANGCSDACTTVINAPNAPPNLSLTKTAPCLGTNGGTITFTLTVENIGATDATGVVVTDDLIVAGLTYVSHTPSSITYNAAANTFAVGTVPANSSVSFDITVQIPATGYYFCNDAAITFLNEQDFSSGNDAARACFTTPATICPGQTFTLSVDASYTNVLWFKDGNATPVGSGNTYVATSEGSYTWTATEQSCPQGGCCPFIITLGDCCPTPICLPITIKRVQP